MIGTAAQVHRTDQLGGRERNRIDQDEGTAVKCERSCVSAFSRYEQMWINRAIGLKHSKEAQR